MVWLHQVVVAIDQVFNALIPGGWADETLSSRAHRMAVKGHRWFGWTAGAINGLFFWQKDHCRSAYESERLRRHLPPEFRDAN